MSNEVTKFENHHMAAMIQIASLAKLEKDTAEQIKNLKADLEKAMNEHEIKSIDNDYLKITRVAASSSTSLDIKKLQKEEPKLYGELIEDYPKVTNRKAYVKFSVK